MILIYFPSLVVLTYLLDQYKNNNWMNTLFGGSITYTQNLSLKVFSKSYSYLIPYIALYTILTSLVWQDSNTKNDCPLKNCNRGGWGGGENHFYPTKILVSVWNTFILRSDTFWDFSLFYNNPFFAKRSTTKRLKNTSITTTTKNEALTPVY